MKKSYSVCYMILTHGRAYNQITLRTLKQLGITKHVYLIVDDEDEQKETYIEEYGKQVIIFDKEKEEQQTDTLDNTGTRSVVLFARNVAIRTAKEKGYEYVVILDDDITEFSYRYVKGNKFTQKKVKQKQIFSVMLEYMQKANLDIISFGNNLDYIGGQNGLYKQGIVRKANNIFIMKTNTDITFKSRFDEDTVTCYSYNKQGKLIFDVPLIMVKAKDTGKAKSIGGMKEAYDSMSEYLKVFYSMICMPDTARIKVDKKGNIKLLRKNSYPMIISEVYKK